MVYDQNEVEKFIHIDIVNLNNHTVLYSNIPHATLLFLCGL